MVADIFRYVLFAAFPLAMAYAAASDLFTMTISNKLTLAMVAGFVLLSPLVAIDLNTFAMHWAAAAAVLAVAFFCFAMGWIGGGDAKLASAIALWVGWNSTIEFVALASVFGGVLTLLLLTFRRAVLPAFIVRQPWIRRLHDERVGVPYGVALAAAGLAIYPHTVWMHMAIG
jgi:prepilin peptidase CpaA